MDYFGTTCIYDMILVDEYFDFDIVTKLNYFQHKKELFV